MRDFSGQSWEIMVNRRLLSILLCGAVLGGCRASPWATHKSESPATNAADAEKNGSKANAANRAAHAEAAPSVQKTSPSAVGEATAAAGNPPADAQSLQDVMAEVRELGVLDPQEQHKLLEDLRQTDPALWPLLTKQVRATVAYRRKSMPKESANAAKFLEVAPATAVAATFAAKQTHGNANSPLGKPRDIQSLDPKSLETEDRISPVSYEKPVAANLPAKIDPAENVLSKSSKNAAVGEPTSAATAQNADWRELIERTIAAMEADAPEKPKTAEELARQARLRMLYALAGRREEAAKPIPAAPPALQDFWAKELYGLTVLLDTARAPDAMSRAAEAKQHLGEGYARLGEMAPLSVRNLSFCTVVQSYGCYTPFKKYEFLPEQEVLLYAEVENFGIESTAKGYHTALRSSYQILDKSGQRIADRAISTTEEYCQNPRRDFFIGYQLRMPPRINPGNYTLQLTIEDLKSQKVGQASVELSIKGGEKEKAER
ncbi:MAG: hypothetical protein IT426_12485 [Pirellulales bacterium]|nr:hypothetical protein [Pirellulales bacterium]